MSEAERTATYEWIDSFGDKIQIPEEIHQNDEIRGIYGIFTCDGNGNEECVYIGKATSMKERIKEHFSILKWLKREALSSEPPQYIKVMNDALDHGSSIAVKILEKVDYEYENYYRDLHHLAFREYYYIEEYQKKRQCLYQVPEGSYTLRGYEAWLENKNLRN